MIVILSVRRRAANQAYANRCRLLAAAVALAVPACSQSPKKEEVANTAADTATDSARMERERPHVVPVPKVALPPLADSIAKRLVFAPTTQSVFVVALRTGKLFVDLGRVDDNVSKTPERLAAYRAAVEARSPVEKGARLRVRGPWGEARDATVESFDVLSGRIVGVLAGNITVDSAIKVTTPFVGLAELALSAAPAHPVATTAPASTTPSASTNPPAAPTLPNATPSPNPSTPASVVPPTCTRVWDDSSRGRASSVRDSLEQVLRAGDQPVYPRLLSSLKTKRSMMPGCFPGGSAIVAVALYGGDFEWVRERIVLLTNSGGVRTLPVRDYRMHAHELLDAFDADDNGTDDVAARGFTTRAGAQVVLRFTQNRLERIAAGFAWER